MAYGDFKDLARRAASHKFLRDKAFNIAKNPKHDGYQRGLTCMVYKLFDKISKGASVNTPLESNEKLPEVLHKPSIRKFKKRTVYSRSKDNVWGADLADLQLISKFNIRFRFFLRVIDIFSKYAWDVPFNDKKVLVLLMLFKKY